jgi:hypothetical protein
VTTRSPGRRRGRRVLHRPAVRMALALLTAAVLLLLVHAVLDARDDSRPVDGTVAGKYLSHRFLRGQVHYLSVQACFPLPRSGAGPARECEQRPVAVDADTWAHVHVGDRYHRSAP